MENNTNNLNNENDKYFDYIMPSAKTGVLEIDLLRQIGSIQDTDITDFHKKIIALNLGLLGIESGVGFKYTTFDKKELVMARYNSLLNAELFSEKFKNINLLGAFISSASHETMHKKQEEMRKKAKYFGPNSSNNYLADNPVFALICNFDLNIFYYINKEEVEAHLYGHEFSINFINRALACANSNAEKIAFLNKLLEEAVIMADRDKAVINLQSKNFEKLIPEIYKRSVGAFNLSFNILKKIINKTQLTDYQKEYVNFINEIYNSSYWDYNVVSALFVLLGRCPVRENVEKCIDFAVNCDNPYLKKDLINNLIINAVPLLKIDMTKLIMSSANNKSWGVLLGPYTFSMVEEEFLAKNFLVAYGKDSSLEYFKFFEQLFKEKDISVNTDFSKIYSVIESYSNEKLVVNGQTFDGCSALVNFALEKLIKEEKISQSEVSDVRVSLLRNLSIIVNNFNYPSPDNTDYLEALENFIQNPLSEQIEDNPEEVSEISFAYPNFLAEKLSKYISAVRQQGTQRNPQDTVFYSEQETLDIEESIEYYFGEAKKIEDRYKECAIRDIIFSEESSGSSQEE